MTDWYWEMQRAIMSIPRRVASSWKRRPATGSSAADISSPAIAPARVTVTRMPRSRSSSFRWKENCSSPAFAA